MWLNLLSRQDNTGKTCFFFFFFHALISFGLFCFRNMSSFRLVERKHPNCAFSCYTLCVFAQVHVVYNSILYFLIYVVVYIYSPLIKNCNMSTKNFNLALMFRISVLEMYAYLGAFLNITFQKTCNTKRLS